MTEPFFCSMCGEATLPWFRDEPWGRMWFNDTCEDCRKSYYRQNATNKHGERRRFCIVCGIEFRKRSKTVRIGKGRKEHKRVEFCTSCLFCPDCRFENRIHDARRGRM